MRTILADHATLEDALDRKSLVVRLGDRLMSCAPPHVFGVHGDWGSGKTSFLHQLHAFLTGRPADPMVSSSTASGEVCKALYSGDTARQPGGWKVGYRESAAVVWFEAWRYQHESTPIVALLHEIRAQLPMSAHWLNKGKKLGEVAIRSALESVSTLTKWIGIQGSKIQEAGEKWEREHLASKLPSTQIREQLNHAFKQLLNGSKDQKGRIVVLIDDLDRCEPEAAFRLLEGLKVYLSIPSCVVVLAMDQRIVEDAIARNAPGVRPQAESAGAKPDARPGPLPPDVRVRAREYLDKLCQDIIHLPLVADVPGSVERWMKELAAGFGDDANTRNSERAKADKLVSTIVALIRKEPRVLPANARSIKGFANTVVSLFGRADTIARALDTDDSWRSKPALEKEERVAGVMLLFGYLYRFHPDIYRRIEHDPGFYPKLSRWCDKPGLVKHPILHELEAVLCEDEERASKSAEAASATQPTHPDPARGNVLRIQPFINDLGSIGEEVIRAATRDA